MAGAPHDVVRIHVGHAHRRHAHERAVREFEPISERRASATPRPFSVASISAFGSVKRGARADSVRSSRAAWPRSHGCAGWRSSVARTRSAGARGAMPSRLRYAPRPERSSRSSASRRRRPATCRVARRRCGRACAAARAPRPVQRDRDVRMRGREARQARASQRSATLGSTLTFSVTPQVRGRLRTANAGSNARSSTLRPGVPAGRARARRASASRRCARA